MSMSLHECVRSVCVCVCLVSSSEVGYKHKLNYGLGGIMLSCHLNRPEVQERSEVLATFQL